MASYLSKIKDKFNKIYNDHVTKEQKNLQEQQEQRDMNQFGKPRNILISERNKNNDILKKMEIQIPEILNKINRIGEILEVDFSNVSQKVEGEVDKPNGPVGGRNKRKAPKKTKTHRIKKAKTQKKHRAKKLI